MTNMLWFNKSVLNNASRFKGIRNDLAKRPKGMNEEQWQEYMEEERLNKLILLDKVPKSKKSSVPRRPQEEE